MKNSVVNFVNIDTSCTMVLVPDAYEFQPKGKLKFLQIWLWKLLDKMKALDLHHKPTYSRNYLTVDRQDLIHKLHEQGHLLYQNFRENGSRVLMGGGDFAKMMSTPEIQQYITFTTELERMTKGRYGADYKIINLQIEIIPWMKGILVMP